MTEMSRSAAGLRSPGSAIAARRAIIQSVWESVFSISTATVEEWCETLLRDVSSAAIRWRFMTSGRANRRALELLASPRTSFVGPRPNLPGSRVEPATIAGKLAEANPPASELEYTFQAMTMLRHALQPFLILAVLLFIPVGVSSQVACCAGVSARGSMGMAGEDSGEGTGCCDQAQDNAIVRRCCDGGERSDRLQDPRQVSIATTSMATTVALPPAAVLRDLPLFAARWSPPLPLKSPDLLALHSVLLI